MHRDFLGGMFTPMETTTKTYAAQLNTLGHDLEAHVHGDYAQTVALNAADTRRIVAVTASLVQLYRGRRFSLEQRASQGGKWVQVQIIDDAYVAAAWLIGELG